MNTDLMFSSQSNEWATPQEFFNELNKRFGFTLDPCATHENAKCEKHFTVSEDGLKQNWGAKRYFVTLHTAELLRIGLKSLMKNLKSLIRRL